MKVTTLIRETKRFTAISALLYAGLVTAQTKGTFQAGIDYPAGPPTVSSNTGYLSGGIMPVAALTRDARGNALDFNRDGKPDAVVAASCAAPISGAPGVPGCPTSGAAVVVYLGKGDGTFEPAIISAGPAASIRAIAVDDFNADGNMDVVAGSDCVSDQDCSSGSMTILLGNGDGTFRTGSYYPLGGIVSQANTIAVGDINDDGKTDVVVTLACDFSNGGCAQGAVKVYLGNGDGTLQAPNSYPTPGNGGIPVVIADFNKDGKPDVLVANPAGTNLTLFPGNGNGSLGSAVSLSAGVYEVQAMACADIDSDGNLDVVVSANSGSAAVLYGNGDGSFRSAVSLATSLGNAVTDGSSIVIADLNGDGKPDVILSGSLSGFNGVQVFLNDGTGTLADAGTYQGGGWLYAPVDVADLDGDGKNDILLASGCSQDPQLNNNCPDGTLTVLLGNGDGTMRSARYLSVGNIGRGIAAADFNGDGFQDLIFPGSCINGSGCGTGFSLLVSDGVGGFLSASPFPAPVSGAQLLAVADFNKDGRPDVAVFNSSDLANTAGSVSIFLNTGNGAFADPVTYEAGGSVPVSISIGDYDGDGNVDIALLNACDVSGCSGSSVYAILRGKGDGSFQPAVVSSVSGLDSASWISSADLNGDGKSDLVLVGEVYDSQTNLGRGSVEVLLSNGDATFTAGASYYSGGDRYQSGQSRSVALGDVNGDGKADVIIGNECEQVLNGSTYFDVNCANGSLGVLLGNGDGTFQYAPSEVITDGNLLAITLADVNGDGKLDAIASTSTGVSVSFGNGDGNFGRVTVYAGLQASTDVQLAVADLNGDGGLDIVQPGLSGQLAILYNQGFGSGGSTPVVSLLSSLNPSTYGQQIKLTATASSNSGVPTGTITFKDGDATLGSATMVSGRASLSTSSLSAGTHSIVASYGGDANFGVSSSPLIQQVVNQASAAISISNLPAAAIFGGSFIPTFAYTGDGTTSVSSSTPAICAVFGSSVNFIAVGTCTLAAHGAAGTNYLAVDGASQSFSIAQQKPTISINNLPSGAQYGGSFTPAFAYTGDGSTSVSSGTTAICSVSGAFVSFVGVGTCTLTAHASATANSTGATGSPQSFAVTKATPSIVISNIPANAVYGGSFSPIYSYTGNGKTSTTSSTVSKCTVSAKGVVSFLGAGTCGLTAHATVTTDDAAATGSLQSFTIAQAKTTISIKNLPNSPKHGTSFTPTYKYTGDGVPSTLSSTPSICSITGNTVSFLASGTCTLTATATPGANYVATTGNPQSISVK